MTHLTTPEAEAFLDRTFNVLDFGELTLLDYMGNDQAIVDAARVSVKGLKTTHDNRGLIRYLLRNRHCYAPWMEVLTTQGWKRWDECRPKEVFLVPNPETRTYTLEMLEVNAFDADEDMVTFENEHMSFCVTPDHRMWFKGKYREQFEIVRAHEMQRWGHFDTLLGYKLGGESTEWDPSWEFIGFYLGDGSQASANTVTFHLRKHRKKEYLRLLLDGLGWVYSERASSTYADAVVFTVSPNDLFFERLDGVRARARDKAVALVAFGLLRVRERELLWAGLAASDGHYSKERASQLQFSTSSPRLATQFEALGASLGWDVHRRRSQGDGVLRLTAYDVTTRTSLEARAGYFGTQNYQGQVFCATTSTGLLAVRGGPDKYGFVCGNTTPFEMVEFKFRCAMPIFVARQWIRHRTANVNEMSARYTALPDRVYVPPPERVRKQSASNKQGTADEGLDGAALGQAMGIYEESAKRSVADYETLLGLDIARELARGVLTVFHYTEWIWKLDLHNLMHFLQLRLHPHAQEEIRVYAEAMRQPIAAACPLAWEAFEDYRLNAVTFSAGEAVWLSQLLGGDAAAVAAGSEAFGDGGDHGLSPREDREFRAKLKAMLGED